MSKEAMKLALEALENSIDLVSQEARNAEELYGKYPSRLARIQGLVAFEVAHEKAITALREALAKPDFWEGYIPEPVKPAQQEPVACKTLCELCVKRGYIFCANAAQTTPIPSPPPAQRKPLTDEQKRELIKKSAVWDMHLHVGWYSAPSKSFVEKAIQLISDIEAAHGIKENT